MTLSDIETAERVGRRRARMLPVMALLFIALQAQYWSMPEAATRPVDQFKVAAWLVWALALLVLLASGGGLVRRRRIRPLLNDESTRAHRRTAYTYGFWAAVGTLVGLYVVTMFEPVSGREAVHVTLSVAVFTALMMFGMLERRALRDA
jgi:magnesium-transporting ATPase (P-type)